MMPRAHVEPKGTIDQAVDYCKKGDFEEFESSHCRKARRARKNKERWDEALKAAKEGRFEIYRLIFACDIIPRSKNKRGLY